MSKRLNRSYGNAITLVGGIIMVLLGVTFTYYVLTSGVGAVDPRIFTPLSLLMIFFGLLMIISKEG